ncbi:hypothetical protein LAN33_25015, partial [Mycobacterium tuberculosis]|nr:hypothetical protein [Mycobacterium tuberculosis]
KGELYVANGDLQMNLSQMARNPNVKIFWPADDKGERSALALPYTIVLTLVGLLCVEFTLMPVTDWLLAHGWLVTPTLP